MKNQLLIAGLLSVSAASSLFVSLALIELDYPKSYNCLVI